MTAGPVLMLISERDPLRTILVTPPALDGCFEVQILPPTDSVGHDRDFATYLDAITYARLLSRATGWIMRDDALAHRLRDAMGPAD